MITHSAKEKDSRVGVGGDKEVCVCVWGEGSKFEKN